VRMNFGAFGLELKDFLLAVQLWDNGVQTVPAEKLKLGYRVSGFTGIILSAVFKQKQLTKPKEYLTQRQAKMPWGKPNLGSIFKNPDGKSAGALIEQAGLKGYVYKNLQVSEKHANIIVNNGGSTAEDLLELLEYIKKTVRTATGVTLEQEVEYKK
ncbi:UDP-N-acetylenolpyruvoylglucosamine reductase, partial [Candidatus Termititenax spirochaetophilus]